jgi:hypothetical protein
MSHPFDRSVITYLDRIRIDEYKEGKPWRASHLKRDGYNLTCFKHSGELFVFTRTPTRVVSPQDWYKDLDQNLPEGMWVSGELFVEGGTSSDVRSVLADPPNKEGKFEVFYSPNCHSFQELTEKCKHLGLAVIEFQEFNAKVEPGYEGFVLKNSYHPSYPYAWMKWKPNPSVDLRVIGFETSYEGKHVGKLGAFICRTDDGRIKSKVGIMTDETRYHATENKTFWLDKIIEVAYQFQTEKGSLRHPRFVRLRDDKSTTS